MKWQNVTKAPVKAKDIMANEYQTKTQNRSKFKMSKSTLGLIGLAVSKVYAYWEVDISKN